VIHQSTIFIVVAVAAVMITRRFNRMVGGILGVVVALGVGGWAMWLFGSGGGLALAGIPLSRPAVLVVVLGWASLEGFGVWNAVSSRKRQRREEAQRAAEERDEQKPPAS